MDKNGQFREAVEAAAIRIFGDGRRVAGVSVVFWCTYSDIVAGKPAPHFSCGITFEAPPVIAVEPDAPTLVTRKDG
jgi:hypothetical protein